MTSKRELKASLRECAGDLDNLRGWAHDMEAAVKTLRATVRATYPDRLPAVTSLLDVVRIAESILRARPAKQVRVVVFPRGVHLHRVIGVGGTGSTYCGRKTTPAMKVSTLDEWNDDQPRCAGCFSERAAA